MAIRRRTRAGAGRRGLDERHGRRLRQTTTSQRRDTSVVPGVVTGALNGFGGAAAGALRLTRDVLVLTVAGAAELGAVALAVTTAGVRSVVSVTSRMLGDIAGTAQGSFREAFRPTVTRRARGRTRGPRAVTRPGRSSIAA
jgi:hypothetical protein